ncbi:MAG: chorismate mutase [Parasphingorhabdus sp.]|jgi:chorismate mutase
MTSHMHPELDLSGSIRPGLDILANEIVIALKKRSRFCHNGPVYLAGLVRTNPSISLLDHALASIEHCHGELGRYTFASQESFSNVGNVLPVIARDVPDSPIMLTNSNSGDKIISFYQEWVLGACPEGDKPTTYGETVTADVNALLAILERVNIGKLVAESKFQELTEQFLVTGGEREAMLKLIVRQDREASVMELAARLADNYDLPRQASESVFRFMIGLTVDIEVDYLQRRISNY